MVLVLIIPGNMYIGTLLESITKSFVTRYHIYNNLGNRFFIYMVPVFIIPGNMYYGTLLESITKSFITCYHVYNNLGNRLLEFSRYLVTNL